MVITLRRLFFSFVIGCVCCNSSLPAAELIPHPGIRQTSMEPFTGKIVGNKVRVRLEPTVDSPILAEIYQGDLVVVTGTNNDFYAIRPSANTKAFVYRTYVIDDIVEGNRVNVRSAPDLEGPVIAQLNKGDRIEGHVSPLNNKWLQVKLPDTVRFYIATEFVEKVGDANMISRREQRRQDASDSLEKAHATCQDELCKPFTGIDLDIATQDLKRVSNEYIDMPEVHQQALRHISTAQDNYTRKKIEHLESEAKNATETWQKRCEELAVQMSAQCAHLDALERSLDSRDADLIPPTPEPTPLTPKPIATLTQDKLTEEMSAWLPQESAFYDAWTDENSDGTVDAFYADQVQASLQLRGGVQPYRRIVKNKPGNFLLMDQNDDIPIAFLYSTKVDLNRWVGRLVMLRVVPRPNNNYAFPAYYVLEAKSAKSMD